MPTYEYVCDSCGHDFEVFQRMSDEPISSCPKCGQSVHKVLSCGLGVNFRGSGFYINDSKPKQSEDSSKTTTKARCSECGASSCTGCHS